MSIFGRRNRQPAFVDNAPAHAFIVHYVEHDKVIVCNAPDMMHAIRFARTHAHVIEPTSKRNTRELMYDNDRICVMLHGDDMQYTCNVMRMPVHDHTTRIDITLPA